MGFPIPNKEIGSSRGIPHNTFVNTEDPLQMVE
jgi:hypothetical protein